MSKDVTVSEWVVVMRFRVPADGAERFRDEAGVVARLLAKRAAQRPDDAQTVARQLLALQALWPTAEDAASGGAASP